MMVALVPAVILPGTEAGASMKAPTIIGRSVAWGATNVPTFSVVSVRFDQPVLRVHEGTFRVRDASGRILPATVSYDPAERRATLVPDHFLKPNSAYTIGLSDIIRNESGISLPRVTWAFRTGSQASRGTRYAGGLDVRFKEATVTGVRFDGGGRQLASMRTTVEDPAWAFTWMRARINDRTYYLISRGTLAGYWVPGNAITATRSPNSKESRAEPPTGTPGANPTPAPAETPVPRADSTPAPVQTAAPTPLPTATPTAAPPAPTVAPAPEPPTTTNGVGILISPSELKALPTSGAAWDALKRAADADAGTPNLADMNQNNNVLVLAKALVYARTGVASYRTEVIANLRAVIGTEEGGETLALGRELAAYAIAADLIGLRSADAALDTTFRAWLRALLDRRLGDGRSLSETHEQRPNNWGTHAGASRAAVAAYLGDSTELARVATVFRGWLGERSFYAGFKYADLWWQSNPNQPVGINPPGATIQGRNVDGVLPEEQRRTGEFTWPAPCGNYPHGAMDGALLTAELLQRAGYPAYQWSSNALLRAARWLHATGCSPTGDNVWQLPLLDARYGTGYWNGAVVRPGKNFGWTDWLYGR